MTSSSPKIRQEPQHYQPPSRLASPTPTSPPPSGISSITASSGFPRRPSACSSTSVSASRISNGATTHIVFEYGGEFVAGVHAAGLLFDSLKDLKLSEVEHGLGEGWVKLKSEPPAEIRLGKASGKKARTGYVGVLSQNGEVGDEKRGLGDSQNKNLPLDRQ